MVKVKRARENPILSPFPAHLWEAEASFNGCVAKENHKFHLVYRAMSSRQNHHGVEVKLSSIGHAESSNGINFKNRRQLIKPEYQWEIFGCEDPRVTKINGKYFIFYTALSTYPFTPAGIKVGVAVTCDFKTVKEKHPVTFFNSKAMALFPEKIKGKFAAVLTVHTDMPPAKIAIAFFDEESQIWSKEYWQDWYSALDNHDIHLLRSANDHLEVGAPPIKTEAGWLLLYSYIKNYFSTDKTFSIEAVLLDRNDPLKVLGRTNNPLFVPAEEYELNGNVPNVIFPSGALIQNGTLFIYYGAADTSCCLARCDVNDLLKELVREKPVSVVKSRNSRVRLNRFAGNPIIKPIPEHPWESTATFNPAVFFDGAKVHIVYRAMSDDYTSTWGHAISSDGFHIDERESEPIYFPRKEFEKKAQPGNSGCEDPRITKVRDELFVCYTAYNAKDYPKVALTSILTDDFVRKNWNWEEPVIMSPPGMADKNACVLEEKVGGRYVVFHRMHHQIWIDFLEHLDFRGDRWLMGTDWIKMRPDKWDSEKIGIGAPPIKTEDGWLLIYHGLSQEDKKYRLGAILLDLANPTKVKARLDDPILEPDAKYENEGLRPGTVFTCGAVVIEDQLFVYYGGADKVVCVATVNVNELLEEMTS